MNWRNSAYKPHVLDEERLRVIRDNPCSVVEADLVATIDHWRAMAERLRKRLSAEVDVSPIEELKH